MKKPATAPATFVNSARYRDLMDCANAIQSGKLTPRMGAALIRVIANSRYRGANGRGKERTS